MKRFCPFKRTGPSFPLPRDRYRLSGTWTPRTSTANRCNMNANVSYSAARQRQRQIRVQMCRFTVVPLTENHAGPNSTSFSSPTGDYAPIAATIFSSPPKLVRLYSLSLRSVWPRCTPSAVSPPRCPVSAGSWWICGSTRPPSPHPSGRRAPVNLFAALLAVSPGTTRLMMSRPSCVYTHARALVLRHAHGGAGCQNGLKLPVVTVKLKHFCWQERNDGGRSLWFIVKAKIFYPLRLTCDLVFPVWLWISFFK